MKAPKKKISTTTPEYAHSYDKQSWYFKFFEDDGDADYGRVETALEVIDIIHKVYVVLSFIQFFINIFHMTVLTRKELRTNLVYQVMIAICIGETAQALASMFDEFLTWNIFYKVELWCGYPYFHLVIRRLAISSQFLSRRFSAFLGLYIAGVRAFSVIFPMSSITHKITKPNSGFMAMSVFAIASTAWSSFQFLQASIEKVTKYCTYDRPSYVPYLLLNDEKLVDKFNYADSCISLVVSILYVFVALALVVELQRTKKRRKNLRSEKPNNTTKLVVVMAATVFASESFYGLLRYIAFYKFTGYEEQSLIQQFADRMQLLVMASSIAHCVICYYMSSQYRDTLKNMIGVGKEGNAVKIAVVETTTHPTTVDTSKSFLKSTSK